MTEETPQTRKNKSKQKKNHGVISEKVKKRVQSRRAMKKRNRPEYQKKRVIVPAITGVILIIFGIIGAVHSTYFQSTDDAFVEGRLISVAPRISGPVVKLLVNDNDEVKAGDLLVEIDPKDYEVKLQQAEAKLAQAKAQLNVTDSEIETNQSQLGAYSEDESSAKSKMDFEKKDFKRYSDMYSHGIVSKQDYDNSKKDLEVAVANHKSAAEKTRSAQSNLKTSESKKEAVRADIRALEAEVEKAKLDLSYTKIYAPQSGMVTSRSVEAGNYLQVGQPLMQIVPKQVWIVANFKEIQLTNMKAGQLVSIRIDTYPNKRFRGEVQSIQRATGAKSSLFPPENAVGSYVKIVQRVPVKIVFKEDISKYNIIPGMSVVPKVKVK